MFLSKITILKMRISKGKYKPRKRAISRSECFIYQLIESCLKLDLDKNTALQVINLILEKYSYQFETDHTPVKIDKMDYRNYRRYVNELVLMSPIHLEYYNQSKLNNPEIAKTKGKDVRQLENLLFLLSEDEPKKKNVPYKKYKIADTDDLVFRAIIQLDKNWVF